jgi:predicted CxxxxCH...CXXCH cytochrome family protein
MRKRKWLLGNVSGSNMLMLAAMLFFIVFTAGSASADLDCVGCHGPNGPHGEGFGGCNVCHGNPPVSSELGVDGLVSLPSPTGATSPGGHSKHATASGYHYACETCHVNGMPYTLIAEDPRKMQMGFSSGGGIYDGRTLLSPYSYEATNGTTVTTTGTMTCSNIYCHSSGTSVSTYVIPPSTSPSWTTPGPLACSTCHGYPPQYGQDQPKSNSHVVHQQQLEQHSWFSCATCHAETTTDGTTISDTSVHVNGEYNVSPSAGNSFTYTYGRGGGTCGSIICHPDGNYHNGGSKVWGNIVLQAGISISYGPAPFQVTLFGSASGGAAPYTYHWEFDDGSAADGNSVTHTYASSGPYYPRLTVTDANFHTGNRTTQVNPSAGNVLPVAGKSFSVANRTVTLTDLSYDADYNLYGHSGNGTIRISWGDGTPIQQQPIALTGSPSNIQFTHTYAGSGTSTFTITHSVTDNSGGGPVSSPNVQVSVPAPLTVTGQVTHSSNGAPYGGVVLRAYRASNGAYIGYQATTNASTGNYSITIPSASLTLCPLNLIPNAIAGVTFTPGSYNDICTVPGSKNFSTIP